MTALLEATDLHTFYGASHVLHGVSFSIAQGETVTLMGRNGMGKTTTIRSVLGLTPPRSGEVRVRGNVVTGWPAHRIAAQGIGLVPEGRGIFPTLTVTENLRVAQRPGAWTEERALALFPRLRQRLTHLGSQLSGGEQQMLAIARALLINPQLVILDGATEGLAPLIRQEIWSAVRRLRGEGIASLIVDKEVKTLLEIGDRHLILLKGRVVFSGDSASFRARADENLALLRA
ncbi:MAG: ABC transporter ATP-binding protein [Deltaproteobacteria bacterium]|nr:MAG: ABC transporter ATP-binding protein [Deltaproteobacteria bacterium]TMB41005.1 MAG: ABC transporter ATP-binding protein [Deltaproteobacteria bacterium]